MPKQNSEEILQSVEQKKNTRIAKVKSEKPKANGKRLQKGWKQKLMW